MTETPLPRTPAWPPKSAPRLFVGEGLAQGRTVTLDGPQAHYLGKVMRMRAGDIVILCDDVTGEWAARVIDAGKREVVLEVAERLRAREAVPDLWLCPALLKKDRFDLVLEKATELGVARIAPVITRRCVADKLNPERARAITIEAAEQCARTALPELAEPVKLDALLAGWPEGRALFFADENAKEQGANRRRPPLPRTPVPPRSSPAPKAASTMPSGPPSAPIRRHARSASARASSGARLPRSPRSRCGWPAPETGSPASLGQTRFALPTGKSVFYGNRPEKGPLAMSTREASSADDPVIESFDQLTLPMIKGEKPPADWRIGTEHEKLVYKRDDFRAPSYDEPCGIRDLLKGLEQFGWTPVEEGGNVIALKGADGGGEPRTGRTTRTVRRAARKPAPDLRRNRPPPRASQGPVGEKCLGSAYLGMGLWPDKTREVLPIMPKGRYDIMLRHMPRVGSMGLDMMLRTCTIQTNLDYSSPRRTWCSKFRVSVWRCSHSRPHCLPIRRSLEGKPNGFLSYRSAHLVRHRSRRAPACCPSCSTRASAMNAMSTTCSMCPCTSCSANGRYIDAAGQSASAIFWMVSCSALPGEKPTQL